MQEEVKQKNLGGLIVTSTSRVTVIYILKGKAWVESRACIATEKGHYLILFVCL